VKAEDNNVSSVNLHHIEAQLKCIAVDCKPTVMLLLKYMQIDHIATVNCKPCMFKNDTFQEIEKKQTNKKNNTF